LTVIINVDLGVKALGNVISGIYNVAFIGRLGSFHKGLAHLD